MNELIKGYALAIILVYGGYWTITHYNITSLSLLPEFIINNFSTIMLNIFFLQLLTCIIMMTKSLIDIKFSNYESKENISVKIVSKHITQLIVFIFIDLLAWVSHKLILFISMWLLST